MKMINVINIKDIKKGMYINEIHTTSPMVCKFTECEILRIDYDIHTDRWSILFHWKIKEINKVKQINPPLNTDGHILSSTLYIEEEHILFLNLTDSDGCYSWEDYETP